MPIKKKKLTKEERKAKKTAKLNKVITSKPLKINIPVGPSKVNIPFVLKAKKKTASSVFADLLAVAENPFSAIASDGIEAGDISGFLDTGALSLNGLVSGQLQEGGFGDNKITVLAGEEATGKTFFVIECMKRFLSKYPDGGVYFFESESAISKDMLESRDVDTTRVMWLPVVTIQEVRTQAVKILDKYLTLNAEKRPRVMFVLDSLGMLSTTKEIADTAAGAETQDMTRARLIKAMFRVLTLKLGRAGVPFLVTNHTYDGQGMFATKEMSGGQGTKYAASNTIFLSSRKDKEGTDVVGRIIRCTLKKGRMTRQDKQIEIALNFETGLNRYYGLIDIGVRQGVFHRVDKKVSWGKQTEVIVKGKKELQYEFSAKESQMYENPEKYFTPEIMAELEVAAGKEFLYGTSKPTEVSEIEEVANAAS